MDRHHTGLTTSGNQNTLVAVDDNQLVWWGRNIENARFRRPCAWLRKKIHVGLLFTISPLPLWYMPLSIAPCHLSEVGSYPIGGSEGVRFSGCPSVCAYYSIHLHHLYTCVLGLRHSPTSFPPTSSFALWLLIYTHEQQDLKILACYASIVSEI